MPFNFVHFASCILNLFLGTHTFMVAMTSSKLTLTSLQNVLLYLFLLKSTLSAINVATSAFLGHSVCGLLFPSINFPPLCAFIF